MPARSPRCTSDSANGSAQRKMTPAAYASSAPTTTRRCVVGSAPMSRAGPTRCGSSEGARQRRNTNITKMPMSTIESTIVSVSFSGRVSE